MGSRINDLRLRWAQGGVLLLLAMASILAYLSRHSLAVANTTIQRELGINNEQFGWLYGAFSLGYMILQIPGGWMGQKLGVRLALPLMAILWSLTTFATAFVSTLTGLLIIRFLFGLAQAGLVPNQALVVRDWFDVGKRGMASGVMVAAMSVGSMASLSLTSWLMKETPWRTIFIGYSTLGCVWAIVFAVLFRSSPQCVRWLRCESESTQGPLAGLTTPEAQEDTAETVAVPELKTGRASPAAPQSRRQQAFRLASSRSLWALAGQALLKASAYNLTVTFLPALLEYTHGVTPQLAGVLITGSLFMFIAGSMLGGLVIDYIFRLTRSKNLSRTGLAATMLVLAAIPTALAGYAGSATSAVNWLALAALFAGVASAVPWVAAMDIGGQNVGVVTGFMNSFSALGGVLLSPVVGMLIDFTRATHGDWSLVFWLHAGFYLLAAACWLAIDTNRPIESPGETHAV